MKIYTKLNRLNKARRVADSKSRLEMVKEYLHYRLRDKDLAAQYFNKYLFRKTVTNHQDYIVTKKLADMIWYSNDMRLSSLLATKLNLERFLTANKVPIVSSFAYNQNNLFFDNTTVRLVKDLKSFSEFLLKSRDSGAWYSDHIFIKMNNDSFGGRNIYKISFADIVNRSSNALSLFNKVVGAGFLFQNSLVQHQAMDQITDKSVNTIRVDTFLNKDGVARVFNTTLRFSTGDEYVDNMSHGGMCVGVNLQTGKLNEEAYSNFDRGPGAILKTHPKTGMIFKDFEIPHFRGVKKIAVGAATLMPGARVVGWDIAVLPDGPVIIEGNFGNNVYEFEMSQFGFRENKVFNELISEVMEYFSHKENNFEQIKRQHNLFR